MSWTKTFQDLPARTTADLDHLMWGARDLDAGVAFLEAKTGVTAVFGGVHPKRGTRNALLSLGKAQYFEILALDSAQTNVQDERAREQWKASGDRSNASYSLVLAPARTAEIVCAQHYRSQACSRERTWQAPRTE